MPAYEMVLITRALQKSGVVETVKRIGDYMLANGAILRQVEFMGERELPVKMRRHSQVARVGNYFLLKWNSPTPLVTQILRETKRDVDVLRASIVSPEGQPKVPEECTLHDELKIPMERPSVQRLMSIGKTSEPPKWTHNVKGVV